MKQRLFTQSEFEVFPLLIGHPLASPSRRLIAFLLDWVLLAIPTLVAASVFAAVALWVADPTGLNGLRTLLTEDLDEERTKDVLTEIAPLLVRIDAEGLPASVKLAAEEEDFRNTGEILAQYDLEISLTIGRDSQPLAPGNIRIDILMLIPNAIRGVAVFGTAARYFTLLTAGVRSGTLGKRLLGIRVVRVDNGPLSYWDSFERFGGYLASAGTFGAGLIDIWRDPNRRLVHDRIANTVVIRHRA